MGILTDYFSAADDAQAGSAARTGPSSPDPLTNQPVFPTVELKGIDPFVVLGTLAGLLTDRPYAEAKTDPRHGSLVATAGDEGPWVVAVTDALVTALAATTPTALDAVAVRWAATEELEGSDPADLADALRRLSELCVRADDAGHRLYCWTSL
ncbi:hypothetical protein [Cellulosimicrobium protaetiae]|uniref:Uncharacterized protein n=1 Tax=Cellulosimicrobium protaetiae TaxID=2587808 RepID=A0A6M5UHR4_9MICO|nr:hypothetical protein [Cellulosimicrobium protaetiae]QJW37082.1 hypothetical protein FIC82_013700 [Cellulosimicrobium protaetiae]